MLGVTLSLVIVCLLFLYIVFEFSKMRAHIIKQTLRKGVLSQRFPLSIGKKICLELIPPKIRLFGGIPK